MATPTLIDKRAAASLAGGYHPEHVMRLSRQGRFPRPVRLGPTPRCRVMFLREEVAEWIEKRIAERDAKGRVGQCAV